MPIVDYVVVQPTADRGTSNNVDFRPNVDLPDTVMTPADLGLSLSVSWDLYIAGERTTFTPQPAPSAGPATVQTHAMEGSANNPTFDVTLPSTAGGQSDITDGNFLVMLVSYGDQTANITTPAGWTLLRADLGTYNSVAIYTKVASSDSGATVTFVTDAAGNNRGTAVVAEVSGATGVTGNSRAADTLDPASLDLGSSAPTTWIAIGTVARSKDFSTFPTGYGNTDFALALPPDNNSGSHTSTAIATLDSDAQTQDPDAFVSVSTESDSAYLIGVR